METNEVFIKQVKIKQAIPPNSPEKNVIEGLYVIRNFIDENLIIKII